MMMRMGPEVGRESWMIVSVRDSEMERVEKRGRNEMKRKVSGNC